MNNMYQCDELKSGKVTCGECRYLLECDRCIEDSRLMPMYKLLHPEHKPHHFVPRSNNC